MRVLLKINTLKGLWNNNAISRLRIKPSQPFRKHWVRQYTTTETRKAEAPLFVSCEWLKQETEVNKDTLSLLDVTWFIEEEKNGREEYLKRHLPGAVFLDMFEGAEHTDLILRNVPDMSKFEASLQEAGVNQNSHVIVYDSEGRSGFYAASRAAWQMKLYGKEAVSVLNGGLQRWEKLGYPLTTEVPTVKRGDFRATHSPDLQESYGDMQRKLGSVQFIDSRPSNLFEEISIKGSISIPYNMYFKDGVLKSKEELQQLFEEKGVDLKAPVVATCWIGMTACSLSLALQHVGVKDVSVYTGSITEFRQRAAPEQMESQ